MNEDEPNQTGVTAVGSHFPRLHWVLTRLVIVSAVLFVPALFMRHRLPPAALIRPELVQQPRQTDTTREKFSFSYRGATYDVTPVADYELWGLVVSHNRVGSIGDLYHTSDSVDIKDICVLFGGNVQRDDYRRMQFSSVSYVCYYRYPQGVTFTPAELANNHLLASDPRVRRDIGAIQIGDQVHLRGLLVNYSRQGTSFTRKTSTTRSDVEMGACEVIFVEQAHILQPGNPGWRLLYSVAKGLLLSGLLVKAGLFLYGAFVDQAALAAARR